MVYISAWFISHAFSGFSDEFFTLAEQESPGGTGSDTGRFEYLILTIDRSMLTLPVGAKSTLAYPGYCLIPLKIRYAKRTGYLTVAAADTFAVIVGDRSARCLLESAYDTGLCTAWFLTVHALELVKDPLELATIFDLGKVYLGKSFIAHPWRVFIGSRVGGHLCWQFIPLLAGDLAAPAAYAFSGIN